MGEDARQQRHRPPIRPRRIGDHRRTQPRRDIHQPHRSPGDAPAPRAGRARARSRRRARGGSPAARYSVAQAVRRRRRAQVGESSGSTLPSSALMAARMRRAAVAPASQPITAPPSARMRARSPRAMHLRARSAAPATRLQAERLLVPAGRRGGRARATGRAPAGPETMRGSSRTRNFCARPSSRLATIWAGSRQRGRCRFDAAGSARNRCRMRARSSRAITRRTSASVKTCDDTKRPSARQVSPSGSARWRCAGWECRADGGTAPSPRSRFGQPTDRPPWPRPGTGWINAPPTSSRCQQQPRHGQQHAGGEHPVAAQAAAQVGVGMGIGGLPACTRR